MNHHQLFGVHTPTGSWVHRIPALPKLIAISLVILAAAWTRTVPAGLGLLVLAVVLLVASRVPWRRAFLISPMFLFVVAFVCSYPFFFGSRVQALVTACIIIGSLLLSRVITLTTPMMDLVDAMVWLARPLDWVGIGAERFGLAAMVMLRSVPYLADAFSRVGEAARARGIERNLFARVTPVVVDAVYYAQRTGEALGARGLGDAGTPRSPQRRIPEDGVRGGRVPDHE